MKTIREYCPHCEGEATLENKFEPQRCECGEMILPCCICDQFYETGTCEPCPLEK